MNSKTLAALGAAVLIGFAGCGSDSKDDSASAKPNTTAAAKPASSTQAAVSFEDVKRLALLDPRTKELCSGAAAQQTPVGIQPTGQEYVRLSCRGTEIFQYVNGKTVFADNFKATAEHALYDVWSAGDTYVSASAVSNLKGLTAAVKKSCGCGKLTPGGFGK